MAQQKNFPLLLRAFAILRKHTDARLVIVGGDQSSTDQVVYQESLQRLARELGIDDCIVVHSPDATLVCRKEDAEAVKKLVETLDSEYR